MKVVNYGMNGESVLIGRVAESEKALFKVRKEVDVCFEQRGSGTGRSTVCFQCV